MGCRRTYAIGELCSFAKGASIPRVRMFDQGDWQYIHYGDLYRGFDLYIDIDNPSKPIPFVSAKEQVKDEQFVQEHDIIYVLTSETVEDLGHAFMVRNAGNTRILAGTETTVMRVKRPDIVLPAYLNYMLHTKKFKLLLRQYVTGMKVFRVHPRDIAKIEIELPGLEEQKVLIDVMDVIFDKMRVNAQTNDYLLELVMTAAKAIYWKFEAIDSNLPAGWRWVDAEEIAELVSRGITPKYDDESDEIVLGQTCVRNNLVLVENGRRHRPKQANEKWLRRGDLLINSTGIGSLGRTAQVWFEPEKLTVDSHITIVRAADPKHALYLGFWAFAHERYIESLHTGSTGQTELPRDYVKSISLMLPDAETLDRFNAVAAPAVQVIVANQIENKKLENLRETLLPKLISGEIDVSKVEI